MFRRSNSSSNIPLLKTNLFGSKTKATGDRRSQSVSRLSQRDSLASTSQLRQVRKSSLDRKSRNLLGLSKVTPISKVENRPSLRRTTPTSAIKQTTHRSRSVTPSSCLKERKTIQKLSSDKKWVADQYGKVQYFIATSSLFDPAIVNADNIKPLTINTFIYITRQLFMEIFTKVNITNENFKEVIPSYLKALNYPGTLTTSVLKTVNTMHSWPQVIGMLSWLIDKVNIARCSSDDEESFIDRLIPESKQNHLLKQNAWNCLIKRYKLFNSGEQDSEAIEKINEEYINNLADILGVDFESFNKLKLNVLEKKESRDKLMGEIEQLKAERLKMQSEIEQKKKDIEDFQETDPIEEIELDRQLEILQINLKDLKEARETTKQDIAQLEEAIKVQPCTYQEKVELLQKISQMKDENNVRKEKIEHAQKIKNKFDHTLANEINKIQTMVIDWNRSLTEMSIKKPELKKLMLREKGFHDPEFLNEIQGGLSHKIAIEGEISRALLKVEKGLKLKREKKVEVEEQIEELTRTTNLMKQEYLKIMENITILKRDIKDVTTNLEEKRKSHVELIKELEANEELEAQNKQIDDLKAQKSSLDLEVKKFGQKMLSFFIEMQNQITNNVKEMDTVRSIVTKKMEEKAANILEKQEQQKTVLKSFNKEL